MWNSPRPLKSATPFAAFVAVVSIVVALLGNAERFEDDETFADARNSCNNLYARLSIKSWLLP
jgi:hypothetical protein